MVKKALSSSIWSFNNTNLAKMTMLLNWFMTYSDRQPLNVILYKGINTNGYNTGIVIYQLLLSLLGLSKLITYVLISCSFLDNLISNVYKITLKHRGLFSLSKWWLWGFEVFIYYLDQIRKVCFSWRKKVAKQMSWFPSSS